MPLSTRQSGIDRYEKAIARVTKALGEAEIARTQIEYEGGGDAVTLQDLRAAGSHVELLDTWKAQFAALGVVSDSLKAGGVDSTLAKLTRAARPGQ